MKTKAAPSLIRPSLLLAAVASLTLAQAASAQMVSDTRSIDGTGNNLSNADWGSTAGTLMRLCPAEYDDGIAAGIAGRPNARLISNLALSQPAGTSVPNARGLSQMAWVWGQFVDHDLDLTPTGTTERFDIVIPEGDPTFTPGQAIPFNRSVYDEKSSPREQMTGLTAWLDGSNVYGGHFKEGMTRTDWLREGVGGRMRASWAGTREMLPTASQYVNAPHMERGPINLDDSVAYVAGDVRANEHSGLLTMHTLFLREHNRVADAMMIAHPTLSDDEAFEAARKVVGASIQAVTYNEFLPAMGVDLGSYGGYDATVVPTVSTEFATAAYRLHSLINSSTARLNADGTDHEAGRLNLLDGFWDPTEIRDHGLSPLLRGLTSEMAEENDGAIVDELRNVLFGMPGGGPIANGTDVASLDIQRGRDHGIADFNTIRGALGLTPITDFNALTDDAELAANLSEAYDGDISQLDLWVGLISETNLETASMGETTLAILADQFGRIRDGDRFFYLNDADFASGSALDQMGFGQDYFASLSLAEIMQNNTEIDGLLGLNGNVFFAAAVPEPAGVLGLAGLSILALRRRR